jgi:DNA polymerase-3 subunit alpha
VLVSLDENNQQYREKQVITVAGIVTKRTTKQTKNGETMAFITIEDRYAEIELVIFPRVFNEYSMFLGYDCALIINGEITVRDDEKPKLLVREIFPLQNNDIYRGTVTPPKQDIITADIKEPKPKDKKLYLRFEHTSGIKYDRVVNLIEILEGDTPVIFYDSAKAIYKKSGITGADVSGILIEELELILGKENVVLK